MILTVFIHFCQFLFIFSDLTSFFAHIKEIGVKSKQVENSGNTSQELFTNMKRRKILCLNARVRDEQWTSFG